MDQTAVRSGDDLMVETNDVLVRLSESPDDLDIDLLRFSVEANRAREALVSIEIRLARDIQAARDAVRVAEDGLAEHERLVHGLRTSVEGLFQRLQDTTPPPDPDRDPDPGSGPGSGRPRLTLVGRGETPSVTGSRATEGSTASCRRCGGSIEAGGCAPCQDALRELRELTVELIA